MQAPRYETLPSALQPQPLETCSSPSALHPTPVHTCNAAPPWRKPDHPQNTRPLSVPAVGETRRFGSHGNCTVRLLVLPDPRPTRFSDVTRLLSGRWQSQAKAVRVRGAMGATGDAEQPRGPGGTERGGPELGDAGAAAQLVLTVRASPRRLGQAWARAGRASGSRDPGLREGERCGCYCQGGWRFHSPKT